MTARELAQLAKDEPNKFVEFLGAVIDNLEQIGMRDTFTLQVLNDMYAWLEAPDLMAGDDEFGRAICRLSAWREQQLQIRRDVETG